MSNKMVQGLQEIDLSVFHPLHSAQSRKWRCPKDERKGLPGMEEVLRDL